jgi:opacity protein-like surface antigen
MDMKKSIIVAAVAAAFVAPQVFAQSANFQGFSVGLGVNAANSSSELSDTTGSQKYTDSDNNGTLQLQYNMELSNVFVLGLGGTANFGDLKAGKSGANQFKIKDAYSLYVAPGYAINNSWLVYGKVAYLNANEKGENGGNASFDNGWGLGLGLQTLFSKNWFGQFEYMANDYGEKNIGTTTKAKLKSDVLTLGVGYKF